MVRGNIFLSPHFEIQSTFKQGDHEKFKTQNITQSRYRTR